MRGKESHKTVICLKQPSVCLHITNFFFIQLKCYWSKNTHETNNFPLRPTGATITIWNLFFSLYSDDLLNIMCLLLWFKTSLENQTAVVSFHATQGRMDCVLFRRLHSRIPAVLIEILWNCQSELFSAGWVAAATRGGGWKSSAASHCSTPTTRVTFSLILTKVKWHRLNPK